MLKFIIFSVVLLLISCSSGKKTEKVEKNVGNQQLTHDSIYVYQIDGVKVDLRQMKKENSDLFKKHELEINKIKARFLKISIENYLSKNKIKKSIVTVPEDYKDINIDNSPVTKTGNQPYTFIIFSDFECPYCSTGALGFEKDIIALKDVKVVFKHFPLSFHKHAQKAAIASFCAHKQNKFWEYHDLLFKNQDKLSMETYLEYAETLDLDMEKFNSCLSDSMSLVEVLKDQNKGLKLGVNGTPFYFLNGKVYEGERNLASFNANKEKYLVKKLPLERINDMETVVLKTANKTFTIEKFYSEIPKEDLDAFKLDMKILEFSFLKRLSDTIIINEVFEREAKLNGFKTTQEYGESLMKEIPQPKESEVKALYEKYKNSLNGKTFDESKDEIEKYLYSLKQKDFFFKKREELTKKYNAKFLLKAPKYNINIKNSPFRGNENAKNIIVFFSDFECPYCSKAKILEDKIAELKNVKLVFKHFPLSFHKEAKPAAIASYCAQKQNKFWEYHDILFTRQAQLSVTNLFVWAEELKLDMERFNSCFDSKEVKQRIEEDIKDGARAKVNGTPTIYINGEKYEGGYDIDSLKKELK